MKLFLDTAEIEEIRTIARWGVLDGVTTNPTLYAKVGGSYESILEEICSITPGPVSAEVVAEDVEGMLREGRAFSKIAPNIVVKVPMSETGLEAISAFAEEGIRTNCTLIFSANQGLLAAKAGAYLLSPFVGRLDDINQDGMDVIRELAAIIDMHDYESEVLAASIRHPRHVTDSALAGAHVATLPFKVFQQMVRHPLTDKGIVQFRADWEKARSEVAHQGVAANARRAIAATRDPRGRVRLRSQHEEPKKEAPDARDDAVQSLRLLAARRRRRASAGVGAGHEPSGGDLRWDLSPARQRARHALGRVPELPRRRRGRCWRRRRAAVGVPGRGVGDERGDATRGPRGHRARDPRPSLAGGDGRLPRLRRHRRPDAGADELPVALDPVGLSPWSGVALLDDAGDGTTTVSLYVFEGPGIDTSADRASFGPFASPSPSTLRDAFPDRQRR